MYSPMISVIIPNFNYEEYVGDCIRSIISQDYQKFEVIVIDDGSTDGSWSVIQGFGDKIKSRKVENGGALKACLLGTDLAEGEYIYILDSDDRLAGPQTLSRVAAACANRPSKVQFPLVPINAEGEVIGAKFPQLSANITSLQMIETVMIDGSYATPPTSGNVYRCDVWEIARQVDYETAQDGIAYLLAPFRGEVVTLEEPLAQYRIHGRNDSCSSTAEGRLVREAERFARRIDHLRTLLPPDLARRLKAGNEYFFFNDRIVVDRILHRDVLGVRTVANALDSLLRSGLPYQRKFIFGAWLIALTLSPKRLRRFLAKIRQNAHNIYVAPGASRFG
jgi:glycosyltransferase involved in cell wall biosynthesis